MTEERGPCDARRPAATRPPDPRAVAAWRTWLQALASDASAALAAAQAYGSLDDAARDTWLDALEVDVEDAEVPRIAAYAPLLSVEHDLARIARIHHAIGSDTGELVAKEVRALRGVSDGDGRIVVIVLPLYLAFVQVFACRYRVGGGFDWASHEPFERNADAPRSGDAFHGAVLEETPMNPVVEELAHAVLAHRRGGAAPPEELGAIVDLFSPRLDLPTALPPAV